MRIIKKELPEGIRKKFDTKIGKKVKIVNSLYSKNKKKKTKQIIIISNMNLVCYVKQKQGFYICKPTYEQQILMTILEYKIYFKCLNLCIAKMM